MPWMFLQSDPMQNFCNRSRVKAVDRVGRRFTLLSFPDCWMEGDPEVMLCSDAEEEDWS